MGVLCFWFSDAVGSIVSGLGLFSMKINRSDFGLVFESF